MSSNKKIENIGQEKPTIQKGNVNGLQCKVSLAAYYKAERRGFAPGHELDDWLEAEHDIFGKP